MTRYHLDGPACLYVAGGTLGGVSSSMQIVYRVRPPDLRGVLKDADVAVAVRERTRYDTPLLNALPRLKLIVSVGGVDNPSIDKRTAAERGVLVCHTAGALDL